MIVGLIGKLELRSSNIIPIIERNTITMSSWFHLKTLEKCYSQKNTASVLNSAGYIFLYVIRRQNQNWKPIILLNTRKWNSNSINDDLYRVN